MTTKRNTVDNSTEHRTAADESNRNKRNRKARYAREQARTKAAYWLEIEAVWNEAHELNHIYSNWTTDNEQPTKKARRGGIRVEVKGCEFDNLSEFVYTLKGCEDRKADYRFALSIWNKINRKLKKDGTFTLTHMTQSFVINSII